MISQPKINKSAHEFGFSLIIETLIADVISMMFLPEWPAALVVITRLVASLLKLLDNPTVPPDVHGATVEYLGTIATALRRAEMDLSAENLPHSRFSSSWTEDQVACMVDGFLQMHRWLQSSPLSLKDAQALKSTLQFWQVRALNDLANMQKALSDSIDLDVPGDPKVLCAAVEKGRKAISETLMNLPAVNAVTVESASMTIKMLSLSSPTSATFEPIKMSLLRALDNKSIPVRQRTLRAISAITTVDSSLLGDATLRATVEVRMVDGSPAVREQAVKLMGDFLVRTPKYISEYREAILSRLSDSAVSVRKRVVRIITSFYASSTDVDTRVQLCLTIIRAIAYDTTDSLTLMLDALGEMWFGFSQAQDKNLPAQQATWIASQAIMAPSPYTPKFSSASSDRPPSSSDRPTDPSLARHAPIILLVAHQLRERPSPLEEAFKAFCRRAGPTTRGSLDSKFHGLVEELVAGLPSKLGRAGEAPASASDGTESAELDYLKVIHAVSVAYPGALTVANVQALLPYLTSCKSPNELVHMELTLRILSNSIPTLPDTSAQFNGHLQKILTGLVNRPPPISPASPVMHELIACFCASALHLAHDYKILARTLVACVMRMRDVVVKMTASRPSDAGAAGEYEQLSLIDRPKALVVAMSSLLCEHADFDRLRQDHTDLKPLFERIGGTSVLATVYGLLLRLYRSSWPMWQLAALQNMGLLLRTYASLWTQKQTEVVMDHIFAGNNVRQKEYLLRIMAEFLCKEYRRQADANDKQHGVDSTVNAEGKVDMAQLVGNTDMFAESSISTQLVQRYLDPVLDAALVTTSPVLQRLALDILDHTVRRGLSHPLHCVVTLIAVETSPDRRLASKALELHTFLATKHGSIMAARYQENARAVFEYQRNISPAFDALRGHIVQETGGGGFVADGDVSAFLAPWYGLLGDKRQRLDFVRALAKALDYDTTPGAEPATAMDVLFARFVADNLAVLPYRSMDEVLTVLLELKTIVSTTGMQALHIAQCDAPADTGPNASPCKQRRLGESGAQVRRSPRPLFMR